MTGRYSKDDTGAVVVVVKMGETGKSLELSTVNSKVEIYDTLMFVSGMS